MPIKIKQTLPIYFATNRRMSGPRTNPRFGAALAIEMARNFTASGRLPCRRCQTILTKGMKSQRIQVEGERNKNNFKTGAAISCFTR